MKIWLLEVVVLVVAPHLPLSAQVETGSKPASRSIESIGLFREASVDFFGDGSSRVRRKPQETPPEALWAEPIRLPDGRMTIYVPPPAVLQFLSKPTLENARSYLAWQKERMKKLQEAMELLAKVQEADQRSQRSEATERSPGSAAGDVARPEVAPEILYVKKSGCPWCDLEDREIAQLKQTLPTLVVRTIASDSDEAKALGIDATPSLVIRGSDGKRTLVRGFTSAQDIQRIIGGTQK